MGMTAIFLSGCSEEKSVDDVISTEKEVEVTVVKTEKVEEVEEVKEVTSPKPVETVVEVKKDDNESLLKEFTTYSDMDVTANNPELQKIIIARKRRKQIRNRSRFKRTNIFA